MTISLLDPDKPPRSSWAVAGVAGGIAVAAAGGLWLLAESWADSPTRTNAYTLVTAIGGVVIFEFARYALTVKSRHRRTIETEFRLRDVRVEEVRQLLTEIDTHKQALVAVEREIRRRIEHETLRNQRAAARRTLVALLDELASIEEAQQRVGADPDEDQLAAEVLERLEAALDDIAADQHRRDLRRRLFDAALEGLPLGIGSVIRSLRG